MRNILGIKKVAFVFLLIFFGQSFGQDTKSVKVDLKTNWPATSLVQEMSEFFAQESTELFWKFVNEIGFISGTTEQQQYESALEAADRIATPLQKSLLRYAMAFRYFSPAVQAHRQVGTLEMSSQSEEVKNRLAGHQDHALMSLQCANWVKIGDKIYENEVEIQKAISQLSGEKTSSEWIPSIDKLFVSEESKEELPSVHFYGCIGTQQFQRIHLLLSKHTSKIRYVFRHSVPVVPGSTSIPGFGVELALKSLEYKTVDESSKESSDSNEVLSEEDTTELNGFKFGTLLKRKPEAAAELANFKSFLKSSEERLEDIKVWKLKNVAFQAAQRIVASSDPLLTLADLAGNFPSLATSITKIKLNETLKDQLLLSNMDESNFAVVNGRPISPASIEPFQLYTILREQATRMDSIRSLGLSVSDAAKVLAIPPVSNAESFSFQVKGDSIHFLNDIETETMYSRWPSGVREIFQRVWPGNFRYIKKNFYTAVIFLDVSKSLEMFSYLNSLTSQAIPIRYGIVFKTSSPISQQLTRAFHWMSKNVNVREATSMLGSMFQRAAGLDRASVESALQVYLSKWGKTEGAEQVLDSTEFDERIEKDNEYISNFGLRDLPVGFMNGKPVQAELAHELMNNIIHLSFQEVAALQQFVRDGEITDTTDIYDYFVTRPGVLSRYSGMVLPSSESPVKFLDLSPKTVRSFFESNLKFLSNPSHKDDTKSISHIVVADFNSLSGVRLASEALKSLSKEGSLAQKSSRVGFLHNGKERSTLYDSLQAAHLSQTPSKAFAFINTAVQTSLEGLRQGNGDFDFSFDPKGATEKIGLGFDSLQQKLSETNNHPQQLNFLRELGIDSSYSAIITNGRLIKLSSGMEFNDLDFDLLSRFEYNNRVRNVEEAFTNIAFEDVDPDLLTNDYIGNAIMVTSSLLGIDEENSVQKVQLPPHLPVTLTVDSTNGTEPVFDIVVVINPLSREAQRLAPILETVKNIFPVKIKLILKPEEVSNLPLKTFYSASTLDKLTFDAQGRLIGPSVRFPHLPKDRLLTLALDTPQSWLVGPTLSKHDLDNIKLEDIGKDSTLFAVFELQSIILQGNCLDTKGSPPRGLQVVLGTSQDADLTDTLVMANFGYFQLKANPGVWSLRIKPNTRSSELYDIVKGDNKIVEKQIVITRFDSELASLIVAKKIERFAEPLLQDDPNQNDPKEKEEGGWSISNLWGEEKAKVNKPNETIHVFSLASGHLYERFLKIMMLSSVKNTNNPVKFWLLANFLSPGFKNTIPALARAYNFEYELVTYKWPSWLFAQTEKQRIIWAYKILFLDVLFPIGLKKVIYVDADQVVRSDLKELWDMDLHGAPYAYTPFCDSNKDTEGFRFWKKGFWESHLSGSPYHISALYVVDLIRFRKQAAGDQLRATYSQLAPDPNSLSNLDQDLPNYVQRNIKIFSLPQEWLWCETWCSNDTKSSAKTIDLCNNPLTKTPKLEAAVKIIPEWTDLDNEVKRVEREAAQINS